MSVWILCLDDVEFHYINEYDSIFNDNFEAYKELFFIGDIHWNKKGHRLISKKLNVHMFFSPIKYYQKCRIMLLTS